MNPTETTNLDFQSNEVRKYADAIYDGIERKLVEAIVKTLDLKKEEGEDAVDPLIMEFPYAYNLLVNQGYNLYHRVTETGGTAKLEIRIYKEIDIIEHDISTGFTVTIV